MYPCSNPELVAAVSEAGGLGIVQPVSLTYVYGYDFREGLRYIKSLTSKPIGMNVLIEQSSSRYHKKMQEWIDIALEEGVMFFITSLGKPDWVVEKVHAKGGKVYHDVTALKWAKIAQKAEVDGLICVNASAGGHSGDLDDKVLYDELKELGLPLVCAGGVSDKQSFTKVLDLGFQAVQMGTRFIASQECEVPLVYKQAIVNAKAKDIVYTLNLTGVKVSLINSKYVEKLGLVPNAFVLWMLSTKGLKHLVRLFYTLRSLVRLKASIKENSDEFFQAGKSVEGVHEIKPVSLIVKELCS